MPKKKNLRCTRCKRVKPSVRRRMDPYDHEILGKKIYRQICVSCESAIADEV
jgi:hypothetical protein